MYITYTHFKNIHIIIHLNIILFYSCNTIQHAGVINAAGGPPLPNPNICLLPETIMKA